ncbi:MAG: hypothetical protein AMXMBFR12_06620 [Candidatus Babeliales bacterium]
MEKKWFLFLLNGSLSSVCGMQDKKEVKFSEGEMAKVVGVQEVLIASPKSPAIPRTKLSPHERFPVRPELSPHKQYVIQHNSAPDIDGNKVEEVRAFKHLKQP